MTKPRKKPTNVTIDPDLLVRARSLDINISRALEEKLSELVSKEAGPLWLKRNRAAIEAYNARVTQGELLSDDEPLF